MSEGEICDPEQITAVTLLVGENLLFIYLFIYWLVKIWIFSKAVEIGFSRLSMPE